jgi:hypothetical protein
MSTWALLEDNTVVNLIEAPSDYVAPDGLVGVQNPVGAIIGGTWAGGVFIPPAPPVLTTAQLVEQANQHQTVIMGGGVSVEIGTQAIECSTDPTSLVLLQGAAALASTDPSMTFNWVASSGPVVLTATQILTMLSGVTVFIQSTFTTLAAVVLAIQAGTITTSAQIDNPPSPVPAWPVNS